MRTQRILLRLTLLLIAMTATVAGTIVPIPGTVRVRPVFDKSDIVCECVVRKILNVHDHQMNVDGVLRTVRDVTATVDVEDLYKQTRGGRGNTAVTVEEHSPQNPLGPGSILESMQGKSAIVFLVDDKNNDVFEFSDPFIGATTFERIPRQSNAAGIAKLEGTLVAIATRSPKEDQAKALHLLQGFDQLSDNSSRTITAVSQSQNPEVAFAAIAVLLKARTPTSVELLVQKLREYTGATEPMSVFTIGIELGQFKDERARPVLESLLNSRFESIRTGALEGLRSIKSPESGAALIRSLDDPSQRVQYIAVITLAEIFNKGDETYGPSMPLFANHPLQYIAAWKKWWAEREQRLPPATNSH